MKYYKSTWITSLIEHIKEEGKINVGIHRDRFYTLSFQLQEWSLNLSILYKENILWKENQGKIED